VGQFLQMKMIEILYFGYLLDVNPFDQPQVELYINKRCESCWIVIDVNFLDQRQEKFYKIKTGKLLNHE